MNVSLKIENDEELRAYIKDLIKGQVLSISREELASIMKEEVQRKIKGTNQSNFDYQVRHSIGEGVKIILREDHKVGEWGNKFIEPTINKRLDEVLKNYNFKTIVDKLANEKISKLIREI